MTSTIEVPISLIKAGDMDAIRELLPKPSLFGRWATHSRLGRGIIHSINATESRHVAFAHPIEMNMDGSEVLWVNIEDLTLDPVELTTKADFENAPVGTIVAHSEDYPLVKNGQGDWWDTYHNVFDEKELAGTSRKVLRWGWGEQQ